MGLFRPVMYKKNIFDIDYTKLKEMGITCIIFDLDNTIGLIDNKSCPSNTKKLINSLKKDFLILICSNNFKGRLKPYMDELGVNGCSFSLKPSVIGLNRIRKKYNLKKSEMCLVGDQLVTDILAANRFKIVSVLVDPLSDKDIIFTGVSRKIEAMIIKKYQKKGILTRGKYYE